MFGYIKPYENELKVKDLKLYRCLYCGLCRSAGKHISIFSRLFLSYDYTLFAAIRMIFEKTPYTFGKKRCGYHLFAKKDVIEDNGVLALSSAIFSILTYYKVKDNIKDESFFSSLGARLVLPTASHMRKRALKKGYTDVEAIISDCMERMSELEKDKNAMPYELSEVFGDMLGYLLKLGLPEEDKEDAYTVGFGIGSFIYNADALDDLEKDVKNKSFNPYLNEYNNPETAKKEAKKQRNALLRGTDTAADLLSQKAKTADAGIRALCEIVLNILYLGCPTVIDSILCENGCKNCRKGGNNHHRKETDK